MPYQDWVEIVDKVVENKKELSILEFGLGDGTEYLLDNFKFVFSHELVNNRWWYDQTVSRFKDRKNWEHQLVMFDDIGFVDYNPELPKELLANIARLFEDYGFDAVFIDGDYHVRGDIADFILNTFHPKYVIIHDTNFAWEEDGYARINLWEPENYTVAKTTVGEGTHIFVRNEG